MSSTPRTISAGPVRDTRVASEDVPAYRPAMRISDVLRTKPSQDVVTVSPSDTVGNLLKLLADKGIGAVVVTADGTTIDGIVSERDIVRRLAEQREIFDRPVSDIMTTEVYTCATTTEVEELAELMTVHRFRHVPVIKDDKLQSIVSIGDVVKYRIAKLQEERDHLVGYIKQ